MFQLSATLIPEFMELRGAGSVNPLLPARTQSPLAFQSDFSQNPWFKNFDVMEINLPNICSDQ